MAEHYEHLEKNKQKIMLRDPLTLGHYAQFEKYCIDEGIIDKEMIERMDEMTHDNIINTFAKYCLLAGNYRKKIIYPKNRKASE